MNTEYTRPELYEVNLVCEGSVLILSNGTPGAEDFNVSDGAW